MFCAIFKCFVSHVRCIQIPSPMPCATRTLVSCHVQLRTQFSCGAYLGPQLHGVCKLMSQLHVTCNQVPSFMPCATRIQLHLGRNYGSSFMRATSQEGYSFMLCTTKIAVACGVKVGPYCHVRRNQVSQFHATRNRNHPCNSQCMSCVTRTMQGPCSFAAEAQLMRILASHVQQAIACRLCSKQSTFLVPTYLHLGTYIHVMRD